MKHQTMLNALAQTYESSYQEYRVLMSLGKQLLHDGKHEAYHEVNWYANGKSCLLEGITLAASALGIDWDELLNQAKSRGVDL